MRHANADKLALYRADVGRIVRDLWDPRDPIDWPVAISATLYLPRPLDHFQGRDPNRPLRPNAIQLEPRRPDLDKAGRALLDALVVGELLADDSLVAYLELRKRYGRPHTAVHISWPLL
jgi:Holliday junction resolvase RusA-like endonuclease